MDHYVLYIFVLLQKLQNLQCMCFVERVHVLTIVIIKCQTQHIPPAFL